MDNSCNSVAPPYNYGKRIIFADSVVQSKWFVKITTTSIPNLPSKYRL